MSARLWSLVVLGGIVIAQDLQPGRAVDSYTREKEAALGAALASDFRRSTTAIDSIRIQTYTDEVAARLAARLPDDHVNYTFAVIGDHSGGPTHEPVSFPGGYIFVPSDLFLAAGDEAEFAGMLAHAMAHIAERHGTRSAARGQIANITSIPLIYMGGWPGNADAMIPVGFVKFQREYELQADSWAVRMASGADYDPGGLARYLDRVQPPEPAASSAASSLPPREIRLANLKQTTRGGSSASSRPTEEFYLIQDEVRRLQPAKVSSLPTLKKPSLRTPRSSP